jgi:putative redox protein
LVVLSLKRIVEEKKKQLPVSVKVKWVDGSRFVANDAIGHSVVMDVSKEHGGEGSGLGPMQLLLVALGGCSGMDVVDILRKQRQKLESLELHVSGERVSEHPRVYDRVHVEYRVKGKDLKEKFVQRAVELSQEKYCSVAATLRPKAEVTYNCVIQQT